MEHIKYVTNIYPVVTQNNVTVQVLQRNIYMWIFLFIGAAGYWAAPTNPFHKIHKSGQKNRIFFIREGPHRSAVSAKEALSVW